jgi:hypothetical protein
MNYAENFVYVAVLVGSLTATLGIAADSSHEAAHGVEFDLPAVDGEATLKKGESDFTIVCFLGTECPLARLYGPRLESDNQRSDGGQ